MAFIGNQPAESFTSFATQEFSTSATTSYTLDHAVTNENEIALFINNVRQQPGSGKAYTATGTALTLSAATASTDTMYCVFLGRALQTVTPATNSITAAMVGNDLISGKTALGAEPADTDEFLVSDAGTLKRVDYSYIKGGGSFNLLQTTTVSSGVSAVAFTSNIDSTYKNYMIQITECHPADDGQRFNFRLYSSEGSPDSGAAYMYGGIGKRSDNTATDHNSTGTNQGQITCDPVGNAAAESFSATIYLYNPSGTTFYKNIDVDAVVMNASGHVIMNRSANNYNETVAYTGISFFFDSGNIDAGTFKLYGIS